MEFILSWRLPIFTPARKAVEVYGFSESDSCHTLIVVQHHSLKVESICRSCFKIECFSFLLSLLLPFFKRLKINLQCILLLKQLLKGILGRLRHENSGIIKTFLYFLYSFNDHILKQISFQILFTEKNPFALFPVDVLLAMSFSFTFLFTQLKHAIRWKVIKLALCTILIVSFGLNIILY